MRLAFSVLVLFATFRDVIGKPELKIGEVQTTSAEAWSDVGNVGDGIWNNFLACNEHFACAKGFECKKFGTLPKTTSKPKKHATISALQWKCTSERGKPVGTYAGNEGTGDPGTIYKGVLVYYQFRATVKTSDKDTLTDENMGASVYKMENLYAKFMTERQTDMKGQMMRKTNSEEAASDELGSAQTEAEAASSGNCKWGSLFQKGEPCKRFCRRKVTNMEKVPGGWEQVCGGTSFRGWKNCLGCEECKPFCKQSPAPTLAPNNIPTPAPTFLPGTTPHRCAAEYKENRTQSSCMDWSVPTGCYHINWKFLKERLSGLIGDNFNTIVEQAIDQRCKTTNETYKTKVLYGQNAPNPNIICEGQPGFSSHQAGWRSWCDDKKREFGIRPDQARQIDFFRLGMGTQYQVKTGGAYGAVQVSACAMPGGGVEVLGKIAIDHRQENEMSDGSQKIYCDGKVTITMMDEEFRKQLAKLRFFLARRLVRGCTCNTANKTPLVGKPCSEKLITGGKCIQSIVSCHTRTVTDTTRDMAPGELCPKGCTCRPKCTFSRVYCNP